MKYYLIIFGLVISTSLSSQNEAELSFTQLLQSSRAYFSEPLEAFFKKDKVKDNPVIQFDHALKGRKDPVDIRYKIIPLHKDHPEAFVPQIKISTIAVNMASNDETENDMVFHQLDEASLKPYNADYGLTVFFQPKDSISYKAHCKATFLYSQSKGLICTFLFFDRTDINLKVYEHNLGFEAGTL